jgi:hypothetical protein
MLCYDMQGVASEPKLSPYHTANRWPTHPPGTWQQPLMLCHDMQGESYLPSYVPETCAPKKIVATHLAPAQQPLVLRLNLAHSLQVGAVTLAHQRV